jgi:hypothetical protein
VVVVVFSLTAWKTFGDYLELNENLQFPDTRSTGSVADTMAIIRLDKTFTRKPTGLIEVITRDGTLFSALCCMRSFC